MNDNPELVERVFGQSGILGPRAIAKKLKDDSSGYDEGKLVSDIQARVNEVGGMSGHSSLIALLDGELKSIAEAHRARSFPIVTETLNRLKFFQKMMIRQIPKIQVSDALTDLRGAIHQFE